MLNPCSCGFRAVVLRVFDNIVEIRCTNCAASVTKDMPAELNDVVYEWNQKHLILERCVCGGTADAKFQCWKCNRRAASAADWNKIVRLKRLLLSCINFVPGTLAKEIGYEVY